MLTRHSPIKVLLHKGRKIAFAQWVHLFPQLLPHYDSNIPNSSAEKHCENLSPVS